MTGSVGVHAVDDLETLTSVIESSRSSGWRITKVERAAGELDLLDLFARISEFDWTFRLTS